MFENTFSEGDDFKSLLFIGSITHVGYSHWALSLGLQDPPLVFTLLHTSHIIPLLKTQRMILEMTQTWLEPHSETQISSLGDRREISSINPAMPPAFISCSEEERLKPAQFSLIYWWRTVSCLINRYRLERRMPKPYPGDSRFRRKSHFVN